ncbi:MAG: hypothetical protein AAB834_02655, partial [Patescibacteria group bacterium]
MATAYTGDKNLVFSGANASPSPATNPTATNKTSTAIDFGSTTVVTFASGAGTSTMKLYKAESASVNVTDGSITATSHELAVTVSATTKSKLLFGTPPSTPVTAGATWTSFTIKITDVYGNQTTDTDNVVIAPSSGSFASGTTTRAAVSGLAT